MPTAFQMHIHNFAANSFSERRITNWRKASATSFFVLIVAMMCSAQSFETVAHFGKVGSGPEYGALVQGLDGNLYGTTSFGGTNDKGTVFKMTPSGRLTSLYSFCTQPNCTDGEDPSSGLFLASDGNFYGATYIGGAYKAGSIYKITSTGTLTTVHSFDTTDGLYPQSTLMQASNGRLYGTTVGGGANGYGTVFEMTMAGTLTTLYSFCTLANCADGAYPTAGIVQAADGDFYGTTGGNDSIAGTVFKLTPTGQLTTLYTFCSYNDTSCIELGVDPIAGLVQATNGDFYGTAVNGGANDMGIVFKITPAGTFSTVHAFSGPDGEYPIAGLTLGIDDNLYGTTEIGGDGNGTIFNVNLAGEFTSLFSLYCEPGNCSEGDAPYGTLMEDTSGVFYGTTYSNGGTAFSLDMNLTPFVETLPTSANVGTTITILGTQLNGATSVAFNGTSAAFTVVSASEITATVPAGATTGTVDVITPIGTLKSKKSFRVP